ncbi:hypothetical protein IEQ34_006702 [Dendrobium chrysotoxum]|uniref:Uncharacterized protein n=1 Tax=Dendrobium chrysotoxum TaxID=161865 RepID=A0AAV7H4A2_DENCH|nr:hypothetical protein IEQ34_006702 [Dendrobium chrysotoxum]
MAEGEKRKIPSWFPTPIPSSPPPPQPPLQETVTAVEVVEEEKVETFFKLIGNMIAERELWQSSFLCRRKRQRRERELWKPTFQWEDFAGESHGGSSVVKKAEDGRKISRKERDEKGEEESSVDLNLGL